MNVYHDGLFNALAQSFLEDARNNAHPVWQPTLRQMYKHHWSKWLAMLEDKQRNLLAMNTPPSLIDSVSTFYYNLEKLTELYFACEASTEEFVKDIDDLRLQLKQCEANHESK